MCGIAGIVANGPVNQDLYEALTVLQHRGQDASGIMTCQDDRLYLRKDNGLVRDVFQARHMLRLNGSMGIAHCRYPTAGCTSSAEAQPFYVNSPFGISLAHNGNLTNADALKHDLFLEDMRHINTNSDSEILLNVFAHELQRQGRIRISHDDVFEAVSRVHQRCRGAYAAVAMITGYGMVAFRDPNGIRPVVYGKRETPEGIDYMIASESVALDVLGFELIADLKPGEAVVVDRRGVVRTQQCAADWQHSPCIFEYVYFARPDSIIDDISVYKARLRMGDYLASKILAQWPDHDIDVVIPIPDTSRTAAVQLAHHLGVKYREGFIKNRYIGRTFIMPGQKMRQKSVRQKLNGIDLEFRGKNVLLVDDSIVRGTTSQQIIQMARGLGARRVYFASAAPPVRFPNVYGIDMPSPEELVGHGRTEDEIRDVIGADRLIYQNIEDLVEAVRRGNPSVKRFDTSCFDGEYVTGDVTSEYLDRVARLRSDDAKQRALDEDQAAIEMYNAS
ncbi:MAG TPA: amidophosphoribosyltransferase [Gammaproteobacteria bacterium]|nr:amidophosphoribosyltransferase [Gammaproteobacteria bacterium]